MAIVRDGRGVQVRTHAGLQTKQYRDQLHKAGLLTVLMRARGLERSRLLQHASALVRDLRAGRIDTNTKYNALQLGLHVYPDGVGNLK